MTAGAHSYEPGDKLQTGCCILTFRLPALATLPLPLELIFSVGVFERSAACGVLTVLPLGRLPERVVVAFDV